MGKKEAQLGLDAHAHAGEHDGDQGVKWELAASGECVGMLGMTGTVEKFG
jgi:hypothetical protein